MENKTELRSLVSDPAIRQQMLQNKEKDMAKLAAWRRKKFREPELRKLFFELTRRCNERCIHCGSYAGEGQTRELTPDDWKRVLDHVKSRFDIKNMVLAVTGGEPLLYPGFFELMEYARDQGFGWGMTSNATLIDEAAAEHLADAGLRSVSVSIDGLPKHHDAFRRTKDGYAKAMAGVQNLINTHRISAIQITTVVTHETIRDLDELYAEISRYDIDSWRVINMEPIGRALQHKDLMCTPEDIRYLMNFIREKRLDGIPLYYGCQHYLGPEYEREVRDWHWFCSAGTYTAGISCEGDILACLDIERRPETIMGNVLKDDFAEVWKNGYQIFRKDHADTDPKCRNCSSREFCMGGAAHSWDYDNQEQMICFKGILFP